MPDRETLEDYLEGSHRGVTTYFDRTKGIFVNTKKVKKGLLDRFFNRKGSPWQ